MNSTDTVFNATPGSQAAYVRLDTKTGSTCGAAGTSNCGWVDNGTSYDFFLEYDPDRIQISIGGGVFNNGSGGPQQIFDVDLADFNAKLSGQGLDPTEFLDSGGEFAEGNFGFFNFSQAGGQYRDFSIVGEPSADANGPYEYSATVLSQTADASASTDPTDDIVSYDWSNDDGALGSGEMLVVALVDSGLENTTDLETWTVLVTDDDSLDDSATSTASYLNAAPTLDNVVVTPAGGGDSVIDVFFSDDDLFINTLISGFETATIELLDGGASVFDTLSGFSSDGTPASFSYTRSELEAIFGGTGSFSAFARVTDFAGTTATSSFNVFVAPATTTPVPATVLLLGSGLAALGFRVYKRTR